MKPCSEAILRLGLREKARNSFLTFAFSGGRGGCSSPSLRSDLEIRYETTPLVWFISKQSKAHRPEDAEAHHSGIDSPYRALVIIDDGQHPEGAHEYEG